MGPIRGIKRKKKVDHHHHHHINASPSDDDASSLPSPPNQALDWWDQFSKRITGPLSESKNAKSFESLFRISRKTFDYICSLVKDDMEAKQSNIFDLNGNPLTTHDQVAIALRRLSSGESLASTGNSLGINQSTVSQVTWRFVEALEERGTSHLQWPSSESEMDQIKAKFKRIRGLPNCCGAIDTTHILMTVPTVNQSHEVWIDREKKFSMVLQAVVDPDMRFRDVIVGFPGSLSDAVILQSSGLFKLCTEGKRLNGKSKLLVEGTEDHLGEYILGDAAFPLLPWLITPFQHAVPGHQVDFNKRHSATRGVAKIALARLKEMWRIIHGVMWLPDKNKLPRIIFICCVLHNIIIDMEDKELSEMPCSRDHDPEYRQQFSESVSEPAAVIREKLSLYMSGKLPP